jgi:hypothetical protein
MQIKLIIVLPVGKPKQIRPHNKKRHLPIIIVLLLDLAFANFLIHKLVPLPNKDNPKQLRRFIQLSCTIEVISTELEALLAEKYLLGGVVLGVGQGGGKFGVQGLELLARGASRGMVGSFGGFGGALGRVIFCLYYHFLWLFLI